MKKYIFNEFAKEKMNYCSSSFDHSQTWKCEMKWAPILPPEHKFSVLFKTSNMYVYLFIQSGPTWVLQYLTSKQCYKLL